MYKILAINKKTSVVTLEVSGIKLDIPVDDCETSEQAKERLEHVALEFEANMLERQKQDEVLAGLIG